MQPLQAGAFGYLLKDAATVELQLALRSVMRGESYLSPVVSRTRVADHLRLVLGQTAPSEVPARTAGLTSRQREIRQLVAEGHTNKEIARILNLSVKTVDTHRTQLIGRLGIRDVTGLVRYAIANGLITPER